MPARSTRPADWRPSNNHSKDVQHTLDRTVKMDRLIEKVAERMKGTDTLIIFTADHSYDMRLSGSVAKGESILPSMVVQGSHAGEEVLVAAQGPSAEKVRGFMRNTQLVDVMMDAVRLGEELTPITCPVAP